MITLNNKKKRNRNSVIALNNKKKRKRTWLKVIATTNFCLLYWISYPALAGTTKYLYIITVAVHVGCVLFRWRLSNDIPSIYSMLYKVYILSRAYRSSFHQSLMLHIEWLRAKYFWFHPLRSTARLPSYWCSSPSDVWVILADEQRLHIGLAWPPFCIIRSAVRNFRCSNNQMKNLHLFSI